MISICKKKKTIKKGKKLAEGFVLDGLMNEGSVLDGLMDEGIGQLMGKGFPS